jgi:hypothetical protein
MNHGSPAVSNEFFNGIRCFSPSRTDLFGSEIWPKLAWFWFAIHVAHLRTQKPTS